MSTNNTDIIMSMLLADLGLYNAPSALSEYLNNLIDVAEMEIARRGITLDLSDISHCQIVEMYTAYLYRKRASEETAMPRMLLWALNNLLMSQKGQTDV